MPKAAAYDPIHFDRMISVIDSIHKHRVEAPINKSDEMYYRIVGDYFKAVRDAGKMGKKLIYHTAVLPIELFYALDCVPLLYESVASILCNLSGAYPDALATGKAYGLAPETCSSYRLLTGVVLNGWFPRPDAIVWSNMVCDNTGKTSDNFCRLWNCPGYLVDRGYYHNERALRFFVDELRGLIEFVEHLTGRKMDYDRLSEYVARSKEVMEIQRELDELKKITPTPMRGRTGMMAYVAGIYAAGTQQAVDYFRQLREEAKDRVARGEGALKVEKYRILLYFEPPIYAWSILDWMDRDLNAVIVSEPTFTTWAPGDIDPSKPVEALAMQTFLRPGRAMGGPIEHLVDDMVQGAKDYSVDGVLSFCHIGCRQSSPCNRLIKDRVAEETGLPFLAVENDTADPTFVSQEELRDRVEGFLEIIDERRR